MEKRKSQDTITIHELYQILGDSKITEETIPRNELLDQLQIVSLDQHPMLCESKITEEGKTPERDIFEEFFGSGSDKDPAKDITHEETEQSEQIENHKELCEINEMWYETDEARCERHEAEEIMHRASRINVLTSIIHAKDTSEEDLFDAYHDRGINKQRLKMYEEAIKDFDKAIELNCDNPDLWKTYMNRARAKRDLELDEEALQDYDEAVKLTFKSNFVASAAEAHKERAIVKQRLGRFEDAIKDYDIAIALSPDDSFLRERRADIKVDLGRYKDAMLEYAKVHSIPCPPVEDAGYKKRLNIWKELGKTGFAEININEYARLDNMLQVDMNQCKFGMIFKNQALDTILRGNEFLEKGQHSDAIAQFDHAINVWPMPAAHHKRGAAKKELKMWEEAKKDYDEAIKEYDLALQELERNLTKKAETGQDELSQFFDAIKTQLDKKGTELYQAAKSEAKLEKDAAVFHSQIDPCTKEISSSTNNESKAQAYVLRGIAKYGLKLYADAAKDCDEAIKLNPKYATDVVRHILEQKPHPQRTP